MKQAPEEFAGVITIEWAYPGEPASRTSVYDEDGELITTVSRIVYVDANENLAWADLTMLVDADGRPMLRVRNSEPLNLDSDGRPVTATFPFRVAGMRMRKPGDPGNAGTRIVECPACRRSFRIAARAAALPEHAGAGGQPCPGSGVTIGGQQ